MTKRKVSNQGTRIKGSPWVLGFVIIYTSLQILIPLRHLLYRRDLQWTHEGSNFSWRMRADIQVSVNGKPFQYMFDATCNLSEVSYSPFQDLKWVLPFKEN